MNDWPEPLSLVVRVCFGMAAIYIAYKLLFGTPVDFVIRLRAGRVDYKGKIALAHRSALADLLVNDLKLQGPVKIVGFRAAKRWHLRFRGNIGEAAKQRIRNFLLSRL